MGGCWSEYQTCRILRAADRENAPRYEQSSGYALVRCVDVYDGDTFTALIVVNKKPFRRRCRCVGYDSPEMKGPDADKPRAMDARDHLKQIIPSGIFRIEYTGTDKYGRLLVKFRVGNEWLSDHMIRLGHGYAYHGGTKKIAVAPP